MLLVPGVEITRPVPEQASSWPVGSAHFNALFITRRGAARCAGPRDRARHRTQPGRLRHVEPPAVHGAAGPVVSARQRTVRAASVLGHRGGERRRVLTRGVRVGAGAAPDDPRVQRCTPAHACPPALGSASGHAAVRAGARPRGRSERRWSNDERRHGSTTMCGARRSGCVRSGRGPSRRLRRRRRALARGRGLCGHTREHLGDRLGRGGRVRPGVAACVIGHAAPLCDGAAAGTGARQCSGRTAADRARRARAQPARAAGRTAPRDAHAARRR